jgi:broad specificity phosphatase PhoE
LAGAALVARGLRDPLLVCGTLVRQRDTAAVVAEVLELGRPAVDGRWDEYDHIGLVGAHAREGGGTIPPDPRDFQVVLDRALAAWISAAEPDGWHAFESGAVRALFELAADLDGRDAIVSTSGGVIAAVVGHLLGTGPEGVIALNRVVVNAGLTTLIVGRSGVNLLSFNEHTHLTGAAAALRTYR